ncbi:MAG: T9SS type A sorting domain-containing protein [bacterium]
MKRIPMLLALVLIFSFGLTYAQGGGITMTGGDTYGSPDSLIAGMAHTFTFHYNGGGGGAVQGMTNGFLFSGGAPASITDIENYATYFDLVKVVKIEPSNPQLVSASFSVMLLTGIPGSYDGDFFSVTTDVLVDGAHFCIDSSYYPPSGTWLWAGPGGGVPTWGGPYCWDVGIPPNFPPEIVDCPSAYTGSHCTGFSDNVGATDAEGDPITFGLTGPGSLTDHGNGTATYSYTPSLGDVGSAVVATVEACDQFGCSDPDCVITMNFTNQAPVCTYATGPFPVGMGNPFTKTLTGDAVDCDPFTFSVTGVTPTPVGTYGIVGDLFTFNTASGAAPLGDGEVLYDFEITITDGNASSVCHLFVDVLSTEPFEVVIEKTHNVIQGMHNMVDVTVTMGSEELKGFDILIAYDASALSFQSAIEGDVYTDCGWEYFNYRFGPDGNCGNGCPSGMLRVVGIAETNNGPNHPSCFSPANPFTLFSLDFLVTDDRTFECMYVPIRFFWMDCGDNSLAYSTQVDPMAVVQGVSRFVIDFDLIGHIEDMFTGFPTYTGVQWECLEGGGPDKPAPIQFVDFVNGGVDIICADSIDARADINLNGIGYEIADAVLFSNYFVYGLGVFNVNLAGQVAATDVNADGLTLSVADLVYLIRVIVGDAVPYAKLSTVTASYVNNAGTIAVDQPMGGAFIVAQGNVTPTLLAENMDMQYAFDGQNTRILITSMDAGATFDGAFVSVDNVISVELATYEGAPVVAKAVPSDYALAQNYPNPFNPATTIGFSLPIESDYTLTIYNVTGQVVSEFSGHAAAGNHSIQWVADGASGIYFYKLNTDNFSDTKKMVLLK